MERNEMESNSKRSQRGEVSDTKKKKTWRKVALQFYPA
jgi:hypothetical protein